ncbi:MAG: RNA 2',3'-cyclic phosphodiesterase [Candidatus Limnocylindrales bacterium]|nr:RNA 2',3'-cyclic phosphodiesterase [Candidatus Limnocylindrales bacterium]
MTGPNRRPRWPGADLPGRRIFIATPLPDQAAAAVAELVERVRAAGVPGGGRDVRWVRLDGLHLTLRFLGPTLEDRVGAARAAVHFAAAAADPFDLAIGGAGTFPTAAHPRALWLGVRDGADSLASLAAQVDRALVDAGWPPETRPFRAHLTLARADGVPAGSSIGARLEEAAAALRVAFRVERIGLFESLTGGGPARYAPLELVDLGGAEELG